jgi:hypothetical protein
MIALGSHVTFTHRAGVARRSPHGIGEARKWGQWELTEPKKMNATIRGDGLVVMTCVTPFVFATLEELVELDTNKRRRYPVSEERWEKRNKTIFQWEHEGSGVVVGQVRKQYGITQAGSGGSNMYGEGDWTPGYFEAFGQVALYVVKSELRGPEVYVPEVAIRLVHS